LDLHLDSGQIDELLQSATDSKPNHVAARDHLEDARRHLKDCAACQTRMRAHEHAIESLALLKPTTPVAKGPFCPPDDVWLAVAAGIANHDSARHLSHAAECDHCGPLLRQAKEDFAEELTSRESAYVADLRSAHTDWQRQMAQSLGTASKPAQARKWLPSWSGERFSWRLPVLAAAALAFAVLAVSVGVRVLRGPSVNQLLAAAYTERRTMDVRIPNAKYSPLRVERGATASNLEKPASLLKAEALISEKLLKNPNDPVWLDARARADLLDGNYDSAVKTLLRALLTQPDSAPLFTDLGSAYYMRGQSSDHALDYGNAIEALGKALAKSPNDPIALFNRALTCEQLFLYTQAVNDWEQYLRQDPNGEWAQEAREHLDGLKQKIEKRKHEHAESLLGPKYLSPSMVTLRSDVPSSVDRQPERYQDLAFRSWLPETLKVSKATEPSSGEALRSLQTLAQILQNDHDDTWLKEFLEVPRTPTRSAAIQELLASDKAVSSGSYGNGIELAQQSMKRFAAAQDQTGMLRAGLALMAAQGFALKYGDCLKTVESILPLLTKTSYRWLQASTFIEQGQCLSGAVRWEEAINSNQKAWQLAKRARYPELELRATAFGASYLLETGSVAKGMRELRDGLASFWQSDVSDKPGENLYACLFDASDSVDWPFVDVFALQELLERFPPKDPVEQAVEREALATAQKRAGDYRAARESLQSASALLDLLPNDRAVTLRKAEIAEENAKIDLSVGNANGAIASLAPFRAQIQTADPGRFQAEYLKTFAEAYLASGMEAEAQPLLERALAVRETGLGSLEQEADKLAWSRGRAELYRDLLKVELKVKTPTEALASWEWYKGASVRSSAVEPLRHADSNSPHITAAVIAASGPSRDTALISYAVLTDSIIAFVLRDGELHVHTMQLPPKLEQLAQDLLTLCSDPSSDLNLLNDKSRELSRILVAPLEADIKGARALSIETDGVIDRIPFGLLRGSDGNYLGDKFEVTYSQGITYGSQAGSQPSHDVVSPQSAALIVVASGVADSGLPVLPGADQEGAEVASLFSQAVVISGRDVTRGEVLAQLRDARLLHFAGHAFAGFDRVGLVLGPASLLSSQDIATLRLKNLRLAVLSACDTANGDEGTSADGNSIARTLVAAGVPNVVASRWSVDSTISRQMMLVFYSSLMSGKSPAKSLGAASAAIRSIPTYHHPYYWASFAVFGNS
jgi:CHAT domain-containing protein/tetratricopeptide (TPR) repeat protein